MSNVVLKECEEGSVAIYITLLFLLMITSAALILSSILSSQLQATSTLISSERAFYAADSGIEQAYLHLAEQAEAGEVVEISDGAIEYQDGEVAEYNAKAQVVLDEEEFVLKPCIISRGQHDKERRNIALDATEGQCALE